MTGTEVSTTVVPQEQPIRWEWRYVAGVGTLIFNGCLITWLVVYGRPESVLHKDALDWCFIMSGGILAGFGFGASLQSFANIVNGKKA